LYQHTMYVISLSNIYSVSSWDRHDTKSCTNTLCMLLVYLTFMMLVHETDKTWYKVLYQHTMYVISLSNISIITNFKQIT
jgi:hypothetical protein